MRNQNEKTPPIAQITQIQKIYKSVKSVESVAFLFLIVS